MNDRTETNARIADVPAVSFGITPEAFQALRENYDLFTRDNVRDEAILDALSFGIEEIAELSTVIGAEAAEECAAQYVLFYIANQ